MSVKRVDPKEAAKLLQQGWVYLDVRSIPEFEQGHPPGAYNIPLLHLEQGRGMMPNPDFLDEVGATFGTGEKIVVGCRAGRRSLRAAEMMLGAGFSTVVDMAGGYAGERDRLGGGYIPGWVEEGLPTAQAPEPGRSHAELAARKNG